ncbi:glycosyltransferase [Telluribacter sp.]|jgi:glycosyltransferase involved in cell wall biosynthesis|uniref:glycosyltransferase n=1 Tax=Telluribacter sp. TaxID=1978767 RepID=UPI002E13B1B5|nr:glycosyltransferase [Telluribacter sp.]
MKVLFIILTLNKSHGGPPKVLQSLVEGLLGKDYEIYVWTIYNDISEERIELPKDIKVVFFQSTPFISALWKGFSLSLLIYILKGNLRNFKIIHIHELWHFPHFISYVFSKPKKIIISTHGEINVWNISRNKIKNFYKFLYLKLFQSRALKKCAAVQVLTKTEMESCIKKIGMANYVVIPNGVNFDNSEFYCPDVSRDKLLFIGRISYQKGLDILLHAYCEIKTYLPTFPDLIIAGPSSSQYKYKLQTIINNFNCSSVKFISFADHTLKQQLYQQAKLFIHTSRAEGMPMAVLEGMNEGLPVLITKEVGIADEILNWNAGFIVNCNKESIQSGLLAINQDMDLENKGKNARRLVETLYRWDVIIPHYVKIYNSICEK